LKKGKLIIGILVIVAAVALLSVLLVQNFITTNYNVSDFLAHEASLMGKTIRVGGEVLPGAQRDVSQSLLTFTIADKMNLANTLTVVYKGSSIPDTFKEGQDVIVEGIYKGSGSFQASSLIMKCPSKYTVVVTTAK
jgi:cytochrome c-type biogenesis protein CcmE